MIFSRISTATAITLLMTTTTMAADVVIPAEKPAAEAGCETIAATKCTVDLKTGIKMAYLEVGPKDGRAVILLHGLTDTSRSWSTTMDALHAADPSLHIFALDQRGHGATSMPADATCAADPKSCYTMPLFANDVFAFMDEKGIDKATIAGHSMGSMITQQVALLHPERVERIILIATTSKGKDNPVLRDYVLNEPVLGSWKKALDAKGITSPEAVWNATPRDADPKADEWVAKNWTVDNFANADFIKAITPETSLTKMGTWIGATAALLEVDNTEALKNLTTPTLVLWASQDAIFYFTPDQTGMLAALRTSKAPFVWKQYGKVALPKSGAQESDLGHNLQWEVPKEVAADILSFMSTGQPTMDYTSATMAADGAKMTSEPGKALMITGN
jgi:pimeloyl-ACP methyl ester carboxylesterase